MVIDHVGGEGGERGAGLEPAPGEEIPTGLYPGRIGLRLQEQPELEDSAFEPVCGVVVHRDELATVEAADPDHRSAAPAPVPGERQPSPHDGAELDVFYWIFLRWIDQERMLTTGRRLLRRETVLALEGELIGLVLIAALAAEEQVLPCPGEPQ